MDTNIYFNPKQNGILITSNFAERQKQMDMGVFPKIEYKKISVSDLENYSFNGIALEKVENDYFQEIKEIFSKCKLEGISFHESTVDLSDLVIDVQKLFIGDKSKVNLSAENFKNLEEITFLSIKTFKGKVLNQFDTVIKAVLWDSGKMTSLPEMLPNLKELTVNKGSLVELDLRNNKELEELDIHYCTKLQHILLDADHKLQKILIENCKNLDVSNLPSSVTSIWPPRKEKKETNSGNIKATGDEEIDNLIVDLKNNMENYMKDASPSYSQNDIDECVSLLSDHIINVFKTNSKEKALQVVKSTILNLNALNDKCGGTLIETNEREQIAEIIILVGNKMGYNSVDEDITEEWREW